MQSVKLTRKQLEKYPEYSCSIPTGTKIGKVWRRGEPYVGERKQWYLGQYVKEVPGRVEGTVDVLISWIKVIIIDDKVVA